jgi:hypothetical protein
MKLPSAMRTSIRELTCGLALVLAGCGEDTTLNMKMPPETDGMAGGTGGMASGGASGVATGVTGGGGSGSVKPAPCDSPIGARVWMDSADAIVAALPGRWRRCGHALTTNESEVGLEIGSDHRYSILVKGPDGGETPSTALMETGQVVVTPLGTFNGHLSFDLDFASDANLTFRTRPFFTNGAPLEMVTTNTDIFWLVYVRLDP